MAGGSSPSFFFMKDERDEGAWTKVIKFPKKKKKSRRSLDSVNSSSSSSSTNKLKGKCMAWRVPHTGGVKSSSSSQGENRPPTADKENHVDSILENEVHENTKKKNRLKVWNNLFKSVNKSFDDLYFRCEVESREDFCSQAISILKSQVEELTELKTRLKVQDESSSVAWNVRTISVEERKTANLLSRRAKSDLSLQDVEEPFTAIQSPKPLLNPSSAWVRKPNILNGSPGVPETDSICSGNQSPSPSAFESSVFTFEEDELRWGDADVGLTPACVALLEPISPKANPLYRRSLHDKLSSPERRRPSPHETKRRQVEKQATAKLNRDMIDIQRMAKLRMHSNRQEQAAKAKEDDIIVKERVICEKLERAAAAREKRLKSVARKAEIESIKVNEVLFINEMTELDKTAQLQRKLEDGEKRRQMFIGTIVGKAGKQSERAEARRAREEDRERQLREAMVKRHEDAEKRKAEALEQHKKRMDAQHIDASAKVSERRTEMEREREAKIQFIKEREERAARLRVLKRRSATPSTDVEEEMESPEECQTRMLQEEIECNKELLTKERNMKKRLNKTKMSMGLLLPITEVKSDQRKPTKSLKALQQLLKRTDKHVGNFHPSRIADLIEPQLDSLIELNTPLSISILSLSAANNETVLLSLTGSSSRLISLVDIAVETLKSEFETPHLIDQIRLFTLILKTASIAPAIRSKFIKLCIYSSFVVRMMNLNIKRYQDLSVHLMVLQDSLALLEAMTDFVEVQGAEIRDLYLETVKSHCLDQIVCALVAAYIAVDEFNVSILSSYHSGLRMFNTLAKLDLSLVQGQLGSSTLSFELHQLFRFALNLCSTNGVLPKPPSENWSKIGLVNKENTFVELVILMGYYSSDNELNQESLHWGRAPTPLSLLSALPIQYYASRVGRSILFPTLLCACSGNSRAMNVIADKCSPVLLKGYLEKQMQTPEETFFIQRFPKKLWENSIQFLKS